MLKKKLFRLYLTRKNMSNKKINMEMNRALLDGLSRGFIRNYHLKILDQLREKIFKDSSEKINLVFQRKCVLSFFSLHRHTHGIIYYSVVCVCVCVNEACLFPY